MLAYNLGYLTGTVVDFWNRKKINPKNQLGKEYQLIMSHMIMKLLN